MIALRRVCTSFMLTCVALLVGCSNGRGSVEESQEQTEQTTFTVRPTITGLAGTGLVLQLNGGNDLAVSGNGPIAFTPTLADSAAYNVTVLSQPANPTQTCTVANGVGTVASANVTDITVACAGTDAGAFAIRGTVAGLTGSGLVLQNNGVDDLAVLMDGEFSFPTTVTAGAAYNVTVAVQPTNPVQTCSIANGSGAMGGADVTNVNVTCATGAFTIGGSVSSLSGGGLVLQNNGGDDVTVNANGPFVFPTAIASGSPYSVAVKSEPANPLQHCTVTNPAGTVADSNITDVTVSCTNNLFTIGGTVSGLAGSGLVLQMNDGDNRAVTTSGAFAFSTGVPSGTPYVVSVEKQPSNPTQVCTVANATGVVGSANITNVAVVCTTQVFGIGGTVTGLAGSGLVLRKNGGDDLAIASNGNFTFTTEQASGTAYEVTVGTQPVNPSQTCTVANGTGTVGGASVRNVRVTCATNTFAISGAVSGLLGQDLELQNNGGDTVSVESDGAFAFPTGVASGGAYNVTVRTQPSNPTQACTVTNGAGTIGAADIANVAVACTTSSFMVGGSVSGLAGSGLLLRNNGADDLQITADGAFTFPTALASGGSYSITIAAQPTGPVQECTIANESGVVGGSNITNVQVSCTTTEFTVGGSVSGLAGSGLQLQNNGGAAFAIAADGAFVFPASLTTGTPYSVSVVTQPANPSQTCVVANGSGTMGSTDVTNVAVTCTTNTYSIGGNIVGLNGVGLRLQLNGIESISRSVPGGAFTFNTAVPSGGAYSVIVEQQPEPLLTPRQTCIVGSGSGIVGGGNVTDVVVTCQ